MCKFSHYLGDSEQPLLQELYLFLHFPAFTQALDEGLVKLHLNSCNLKLVFNFRKEGDRSFVFAIDSDRVRFCIAHSEC